MPPLQISGARVPKLTTRRRSSVLAAPVALTIGALGAVDVAPASAATITGRGNPSDALVYDSAAARQSQNNLPALQRRLPGVSVNQVLDGPTRSTRAVDGNGNVTGVDGDKAKVLDPVPSNYVAGLAFTGADQTGPWYPQGITGSHDATASGGFDGRRSLLVSSYHRRGGTGDDMNQTSKPGVRISFITREDSPRYQHVLLVNPESSGGRASYRFTKSHAGGIAWVGTRLYVAETDDGVSVYDMTKIMRVDKGPSVGCDASSCTAAGYRYVLPRIGRWRYTGEDNVPFSALSVDRSGTNPQLVGSKYRSLKDEGEKAKNSVLMRWPLDGDGSPALTNGRWNANREWIFRGLAGIQGALTRGDRIYVSTSAYGGYYGTLGRAGATASLTKAKGWPGGSEDLSLDPQQGRLYSVTERVNQRAVFRTSVSAD